MNLDQKETILRSLSVALAMFFASAPILIIVPAMMAKAGFDPSLVLMSVALSCGLSTAVASVWFRLPLLFGPGIAGVSYLSMHLGVEMGWSLPLLTLASLGATFFYLVTWLVNWPSRMLEVLGPVLSKAITGMLGVFLIRLTLQSGYQEFCSEGFKVAALKLFVLWAIPVAIIEVGQRKSWSISYLLGMIACFVLGYFLDTSQVEEMTQAQVVWQGPWPSLSELWTMVRESNDFVSACLGLWLIQTVDVAGCSAAMLALAGQRKWLKESVGTSDHAVQVVAPIGNLIGYIMGPVGYSGPHCLHLSSALALCTGAPLWPRLVGLTVAALFVSSVFVGSLFHALPLYVASPVVLWVGIAMIRQLPLSIKKDGKEVVAGLGMALSMAWACDIALSMAIGFWLAMAIRLFEKKTPDWASWLMAVSFFVYIYLVG